MCNIFLSPFIFIPLQNSFKKYGLKKVSITGQVCLIIGSIFRIGLRFSFYLYLLGTLISAIGTITFVNTISSFISTWFESKQILFYSNIVWSLLIISGPVSSIVSGFILTENTKQSDYDIFFLVQGLSLICLQILFALFLKARPKTLVNHFSAIKQESLKSSILKLLKNKNFILASFMGCLVFTAVLSVISLISWILKTYGKGSEVAATMILIIMSSGIVGSLVLNKLFNKVKNIRKKLLVYLSLSTLSISLTFLFQDQQQQLITYIAAGVTGFFCLPVMSTNQDFVVEVAFPVK